MSTCNNDDDEVPSLGPSTQNLSTDMVRKTHFTSVAILLVLYTREPTHKTIRKHGYSARGNQPYIAATLFVHGAEPHFNAPNPRAKPARAPPRRSEPPRLPQPPPGSP
ncbi:hypothetical protein CSIM01_12962 [Colletotrichum simmondsii]|uniref:Uncharacterized protein n=1 Tax=Colletotrichum simmondsii TaxID=703756 RepID=A0A135RR77_9PEZI|nr:hypothetical protein CSIM01_12962 [Colletotrichum simmondsii]